VNAAQWTLAEIQERLDEMDRDSEKLYQEMLAELGPADSLVAVLREGVEYDRQQLLARQAQEHAKLAEKEHWEQEQLVLYEQQQQRALDEQKAVLVALINDAARRYRRQPVVRGPQEILCITIEDSEEEEEDMQVESSSSISMDDPHYNLEQQASPTPLVELDWNAPWPEAASDMEVQSWFNSL
jgi:hypothetical protein